MEQTLNGDFGQILHKIEEDILNGSMSVSLEGTSDFCSGTARCSVRVLRDTAIAGGNRLSLTVTLFQDSDGPIQFSAITTGGSTGIFFKINTWGKEAFLDKLRELLKSQEFGKKV